MEDDSRPYLAEYAKSSRSGCKKCKEKIEKGLLRLAVVVKSAKFDGKLTNWYHYDCFFDRQRPKSVGDIEHFDQLRWEDQEKITKKVEEIGNAAPPPPKAKGKSKSKTSGAVGQHPDYNVEYAKSSRAACRGCEEKIAKGAIRISKKSYDSENARKYGPQDLWHHVECFKDKRDELEFAESAESLTGFHDLKPEDQAMLKKELPAKKKHKLEPGDVVDTGPSEAKRIKREEDDSTKKEIKKQNEIMYKYRDELEKNLSKPELVALLEHNNQQPPSGNSNILDMLADLMTFGALKPCPECKKGQLVYKTGVGYECTGNMSEWTKCPYTTQKPKRRSFKVSHELAEQYSFLNHYKYVERERIVPTLPSATKKELPVAGPSENALAKKAAKAPTLDGMYFSLETKLEKSNSKQKEIRSRIEKMGGKLTSRLSEKVAAVISAKNKIKDKDSKMERAEELGIQVVPVEILDEFENSGHETVSLLINKKNIAPWGTNVEERLELKKETKSGSKSKSKGLPDKLKLKMKGGGVVDPDSGLEDTAHVLKVKDTLYSVVLGIVDIQHDRNSYYKLQILESDKGNEWWLFRSWGRVGTTIGDNKLTPVDTKQDAMEQFVALYEEKTGNVWKNRDKFVKQPGKLYPLDIDYGAGESAADSKLSAATSKSKLDKAIQELICMIFDVETMKRAMVEFELDLTKLPLGKISRKQIEKAYSLLSQVEEMIRSAEASKAKFVDLSNQFYTLIPHDVGIKTPPILDNAELVKAKLEMLESLLEIEVAYSLLKAGDAVQDKDPIDAHYEKLNTEIGVLDKSSDEFRLLETYVKNTHAATHTQYSLDIEEIFKVERKGEAKRFRPFSKLANRKLLWHGSRVSNMAGILSQGLRIAPPEAPVTGYMFGKGIYFADMVSKSANYCAASKSNPHGLLLLCDVALGKMYERTQADYIEKLTKGYQSVIGLGKTQPDPKESKKLNDIEVPLGKPQPGKVSSTALLYNEYIVYDVAQVNIKYLLKVKFNYK